MPSIAVFDPKTASTVTIAADGACVTTQYGPAAGYAVFLEQTPYAAAICEPLPFPYDQTSQSAEVKALLCALELALALRARHVTILSDSQYAVNGYNRWMGGWQDRGWVRNDGFALANRGLWQDIIEYPSNFRLRIMQVEVVWMPRNSTPELAEADRLAKQACSLQHYCTVCCCYIGRAGSSHTCQPVCNTGNCDFRQFVNIDAYNKHRADVHSTNRQCRREDCGLFFGSERAALSHERMAHDWYVFDCEYCDLVFQGTDDRDDHEMEDCDYAPYCRICGRWFGSLRAMEQHDYAVH